MDRVLSDFEVGIFNKKVREAVAHGEKLRALDRQWADVHWIKIRATSKERAQKQAESKYPPENGYVIVDIIEEKTERWG